MEQMPTLTLGNTTYEVVDSEARAEIQQIKDSGGGGGTGADGKSAYEIAVENGFVGTEAEWLESLKGADGQDGESVTVESVTESTEDGGENVTVFSDGKTLTVRNGKRGATGANGNDGVGIEDIVFNDDYSMTITTEEVYNGNVYVGGGIAYTSPSLKGETGATGATGADGVSATHSWDGTVLTVTSASGTSSADLKGETGATGATGADGVSVTHSWNGTTLTITSASGTSSADLKGDTGKTGATGANGYTPQKGVDYWNAEDKAEVEADISAEVAEQLADKVQLEPEFAESLEELEANGDPSKLYVLPDGYIYAYMGTYTEGSVTPNFTNQLPISVDTDGTVYNGTGYAANTYLSSSGGTATKTGIGTTGLIPVPDTATDYNGGHVVLDIANAELVGTSGDTRLAYYDANRAFIGIQQFSNGLEEGEQTTANKNTYKLGDDGFVNYVDVGDILWYYKSQTERPAAYVRLCGAGIDGATIITVNEEISYTTTEGGYTYKWTNTGKAFVAVNYEPRIIAVENKAQSNSSRLGIVEESLMGFSPDLEIPVLVKDGASALVNKALSREDSRVIRFLINSDAHQFNDNALISAGNKEMGQAHKVVLDQMGIDFVANLGDIAWGTYTDTTEEVREQLKQFNAFMADAVKGEALLYVEGNHDDANYSTIDNDGDGTTASPEKLNASAVYGLIWGKNKGVVCDTAHVIDGYCYKDFENLKVRVICLNTEQGTGDGGVVEGYQLKWFAEQALDMSDKTDWSVITLAHHPFDYPTATLCTDSVKIIEAFINGANLEFTTSNGTAVKINYSGKNCQYVAHFHGHVHAFCYNKIRKYTSAGSDATYTELDAYEVCIPNACFTRNNHNLGNTNPRFAFYSTPTTYDKADVDGQRTSFNLVTVCLDDKIIYADNYGAGIDRVINY